MASHRSGPPRWLSRLAYFAALVFVIALGCGSVWIGVQEAGKPNLASPIFFFLGIVVAAGGAITLLFSLASLIPFDPDKPHQTSPFTPAINLCVILSFFFRFVFPGDVGMVLAGISLSCAVALASFWIGRGVYRLVKRMRAVG